MHTTVETIINFRNCPYTLNGENIANLRRVEVQNLAAVLGIRGEFSKNQLLTRMIEKLAAVDAPKELSEQWPTAVRKEN